MFSYFGSKSKIIGLYPRPLHDWIIEPFAGSARYALRYCDHNVWINDRYRVIYGIWKWLQTATKNDIRSLPELKKGESLKNCKQLSDVERDLMGFLITQGAATPIFKYGGWAARGNNIRRSKQRMLSFVGRISHWKITSLDYQKIPNQSATWFVDPPYQMMGDHYKHGPSKLDFQNMADWCKSRKGQVIVCEGPGATWLPFKPLCTRNRIKRDDKYKEVVFYQSEKKTGLGLY